MRSASASNKLLAQPEWTEQTPRVGLDHLGMQVGSIGLYQTLLPGLSNVTSRMRYYGFFVWLADRYARDTGSTSRDTWERTVRRAEALYALVAVADGGAGGVAGTTWAAEAFAEQSGPVIDLIAGTDRSEARQYLQQRMGVFGAAYGSQLFEIGLFDRSDDHEIPLASDPVGRDLATAFGEAIGDAGARFLSAVEAGRVPRETLEDLAVMLPDRIEPDSAEHDAYETLLFSDGARGDTLRLILRIAGEDPDLLDVEGVRWALYAGEGVEDDLSAMRQRWFVYHADDLAHCALESLLKLVLDTVGPHPRGLRRERAVAECVDAVMDTFDAPPSSWQKLLDGVALASDPRDEDDPYSEAALADAVFGAWTEGEAGDAGAAALRLLATLHHRIAAEGVDAGAMLETGGPGRSVVTELRFLNEHADMPFRDLLDRLISERVIARHMHVALRKLRYGGGHTFLFESDEGRLRQRNVAGPVLTNPRLGPALTFLRDLHLLDDDGLTARGRARV